MGYSIRSAATPASLRRSMKPSNIFPGGTVQSLPRQRNRDIACVAVDARVAHSA
jgi:hypothetical protein